MDRLPETPSQTAGPYVHIGLIPRQAGFDIFETNLGDRMVNDATRGERIRIEGRIFDGGGALVRDALVEIWQADAAGIHAHPADARAKDADTAFTGWGRTGTDFATGVWGFETIKPGRVPARNGHGLMAPHVSLWIVARGINTGLSTRMYFGDEAVANGEDAVLKLIDPARRETLIAPRQGNTYRFDIRLQGEGETVFLDI